MIDSATRQRLISLAADYETPAFLEGDPSWFMHQVTGPENQEATAFVAANLSYGRRDQFLPRVAWLLESAEGDMDRWIRSGRFAADLREDDGSCFYRLYTCSTMHRFLKRYGFLLREYGTLGGYVRDCAGARTGEEAVAAICRAFASDGGCAVVPKDTQSACKRICMFLRWMVRDNSPVDLGLWSGFIDRRTLIIPLDTHVLQMGVQAGLLNSRSASMAAARKLSARLAEVFPDDPLRGDFALFGTGVDGGQMSSSSVTGQ